MTKTGFPKTLSLQRELVAGSYVMDIFFMKVYGYIFHESYIVVSNVFLLAITHFILLQHTLLLFSIFLGLEDYVTWVVIKKNSCYGFVKIAMEN